VGIRPLAAVQAPGTAARATAATSESRAVMLLPQLKSYRDSDGKFYFKLTDTDGNVLLQSRAFDSPREAGQSSAALIDAGTDAHASAALLQDAAVDTATLQTAAIIAALAELKADKLARQNASVKE
jgi:tryptophanyl-tRNA synthetase